MWLANGIGIVAKAFWDAFAATANWIGQNPIMTAALSSLLLVFAGLTASITGTTVALGGMAALMKSMGRKSLLLIALLAVWYLFQEYDKYLKGENTWMTAFQRKIAEMTIDVRLFRAELGLMWEQLKNGEIGNALGGGFVQSNNSRMLDVNIFKRIADYAKEVVGVELPTKQQAMIPYANTSSTPPAGNYSGKLMGEARVHITVDQNGKVTQQTQSIPLKWDFGSLGSR